MRKRNFLTIHGVSFPVACLALFVITGCNKPTYPKERVKESVIRICKQEYDLERVEVGESGKTLGALVRLSNLIGFNLDKDNKDKNPSKYILSVKGNFNDQESSVRLSFNFQQSKGMHPADMIKVNEEEIKKLQDVIKSVSRVSLSTDAGFHFFTITGKSNTLLGEEVEVINYVEDVKKFLLGAISRDDYFKRTVIDWRLSGGLQKAPQKVPQWSFTKEKDGRIRVTKKTLHLPPRRSPFQVKDIEFNDFLARQIAQRISFYYNRKEDGKELPAIEHDSITQEMLDLTIATLQAVCDKYKIYDFTRAEIVNLNTGRTIDLDGSLFNIERAVVP